MSQHIYDLYLKLSTREIRCAQCSIELNAVGGTDFAFRYSPEYLQHHAAAFPIDPSRLPLREGTTLFKCGPGVMPGFLDDYLPDDWGKKIIARLIFYREGKKIDAYNPITLLDQLGSSRIGALAIVPLGQKPIYENGIDLKQMNLAENVAIKIEEEEFLSQVTDEEFGLIYLSQSGTGVGGARPKVLVCEGNQLYLAKFNRSADQYNNARVELACLVMAKNAGINVSNGKIVSGLSGGRDALLLERFDVLPDGGRRHLITVNALLKEQQHHADSLSVFRYDDIWSLLGKYSYRIEEDSEQLLRRMLFNRCINNLDDHERNFSLIHDSRGFCLSPAYDLVPSLATGQYPVAGFDHQPFTPDAQALLGMKKVFGLSRPTIRRCVEQVMNAGKSWRKLADDYQISADDYQCVTRVFNF